MWQARKAEARALQAEQMSGFLVGLFAASDVESPAGRGRSLLARDLLDRAIFEIHQLDGWPAIQAEVMTTIGIAYRSQGLFEEAEAWFGKALAVGADELRPRVDSELGLLRYFTCLLRV